MAIADFFHCENISDLVVETPRFKRMVNVLSKIGSDFEIPKRKQIGGPLLGSALGSPNIVTKKVYMCTSTSSGNDRLGAKQNMKKFNTTDGAKQNMTKRRNGEQLER